MRLKIEMLMINIHAALFNRSIWPDMESLIDRLGHHRSFPTNDTMRKFNLYIRFGASKNAFKTPLSWVLRLSSGFVCVDLLFVV